MPTAKEPGAPRSFVLLLSVTCAVTVANLYYLQPLLGTIAADLRTDESSVGVVSGALQLGYAAGLLLIVPLGDIVTRRRLVPGLLAVDAVALAAMALAPSLAVLAVAAVTVGVSSVAVQILVPYAATVATESQRNRVLSALLSAMLLGVLLSRVVAGLVAEVFGWRGIFAVGAGAMVVATVTMWRTLDRSAGEVSIGYAEQMRAIVELVRCEPVLRRRSLVGAGVYGAFNVLWTTIAFLLAFPPFGFTEAGIGVFALVGVAGVAGAYFTGRLIPARHNQRTTGICLGALVLSFVVLVAGPGALAVVILGVLVLDAAVQAVHLLNQNTIYALRAGARARITTVYMTSYFVGGAAGSALGAVAYTAGGWPMACATGGAFAAVALAAWAWDTSRSSPPRAVPAPPTPGARK
ncbi:MAG: Uncharacterized MFS-type transporter [uncultured Pseudonocardia sp.]|uniref:Uncharacterized MFS-type transporter n=1 Tax=uncultured Pseudonocardia sp. TaxID=211455 RepID=A0A6J4QPU2_9PSEU|nr:MAG: Uncharacterized MFS-type transporter [uncultured Pseudonocardia sp.]